MPDEAVGELVDDLAAEQQALVDLLEPIDDDSWLIPTPAPGWDVRDTVAHLADTDDIAFDTCTGGPRSLGALGAQCASPEDLTLLGVMAGRKLSGAKVLAWWEHARSRELDVLRALDPAVRVPWGLGMRPPSFVTARMMETWAHGLDIRAALGAPDDDTDRLRHIAWIGLRALPYACSVAGVETPPGPLRVELTLPSGAVWVQGLEDAPDRITGPAGLFCRVFVQRRDRDEVPDLLAEGDGARLALRVARAYL